MKKTLLLFVSIFLLVVVQAQDVKISKHFFTKENWRVAVGVSLDVALSNSKTGKSNFQKFINPNIPSFNSGFGNSGSYAFNIDVYSANSILGFYTSTNFNKSRVILTDDFGFKDSVALNFLEIPLYLKLRLGKVNGHGQTWFAFGGGIAFPELSTIKTFDSYNNLIYQKDNKIMASKTTFLSTIFGYEYMLGDKDDFYNKDNYRFLFYAKLNYDLSNRVNTLYTFDNNTVISNYYNPNMRFMKVSFGISFLMRINAFIRLLATQPRTRR